MYDIECWLVLIRCRQVAVLILSFIFLCSSKVLGRRQMYVAGRGTYEFTILSACTR